ncbi:hypothetical protein [Pseudoalteromonas umbrosa]|uniref:hypothetical protein n=1 Tax=Pseudoalteromonas umbrosa TaxID=3048489 RepID=UPI0024C211B5|nr:hypothetical protein [Pseudoalteromonas sp. B95]MDK1286835.1 hypothetical protein [Pseudoalteromonas sp. B95]
MNRNLLVTVAMTLVSLGVSASAEESNGSSSLPAFEQKKSVLVNSKPVIHQAELSLLRADSAELALTYLSADRENFDVLDAHFESLSNMDKFKLLSLAKKIQMFSVDSKNSKWFQSDHQVSLQNKVLEEAVKIADERYGTFFGYLADKEVEEVFNDALVIKGLTKEDVFSISSTCDLYVYDTSVTYKKKTSGTAYTPNNVVRAINDEGEWPCDYEVRYLNPKSYVFSNNYFVKSLITAEKLGYGGTLIARNQGRNILFGFGKTLFWVGSPDFVMKTFKEDVLAY